MGRGELLPRLSTLTAAGGSGISLLHYSWGRPRRTLSVILALCSPDFPHAVRHATVSTSHDKQYTAKKRPRQTGLANYVEILYTVVCEKGGVTHL